MQKIPTLFSNYDELMLDIDVYGRKVLNPQLTMAQLREKLFEDFKRSKPLPTLTSRRYELSNLVSEDYKILYIKELELQENESEIDLKDNKPNSLFDFDFNNLEPISTKLQVLFTYENRTTDTDREAILQKYNLVTGEEYQRGIAETEKIFGSVVEDESLVLEDDEIENLCNKEQEESMIDNEDDDYPEFDEDDYEEDSEEDDYLEFDEDDYEEDPEEDEGDDYPEFDEDDSEEDLEEDDGDDYPEFDEDEEGLDDISEDEDDYPEFDEEEDYLDSDEEDDYPEFDDISEEEVNNLEEKNSDEEKGNLANSESINNIEVDEDLSDFTIEFDEPKPINIPKTPVQIINTVVKEEEKVDRSLEPTDIRQFLRKHPRSTMEFVSKYFTKKQINDALRIGKIIKKGNILKLP